VSASNDTLTSAVRRRVDVGILLQTRCYSGRGPLTGWLRVIAIRFVRQLERKDNRLVRTDDEAASRLAVSEPNPEVALLRQRHGAQLVDALKTASAALTDRDRAPIKMAVIDELSIDELCRVYNVHRATVARWIVRLKQQIFDEAVSPLRRRIDLDTGDVESLCRAESARLQPRRPVHALRA
jgi:RNA polymerase sigma-70 factor (ECF subfamily)